MTGSGRRRFLRLGLAALAGAAGCGGTPGDTPTDDATTSAAGSTRTDDTIPSVAEPTRTSTGGASPDDTDTATPEGATVGLETVATGFRAPLGFEAAPGGFYVADQYGELTALAGGGSEVALDVTDRMVDLGGYEERGLLGVALHPGFADNRRLFVRYSAPPRSGTPPGYSHTFVLSEFRAAEGGLGIDPDSERVLLEIPEPQSNHNAGAVTFGPEGHLYVAVGDGGGAGDRGEGHVDDWYGANAGGNGQDVAGNLLGSVLRIDVDAGDPYAVPEDNPLVGAEGLDEHYAWGFRNPWRMSFNDFGDGPRLLAADVGQNRYEEVNVVERGGNYGWNVREGAHCYDADSCPTETPDGEPLRDPVIEYPHSGEAVSGVSVIGGYVYRGGALPELAGEYVFGDWRAGGRLFVASPGGERWPTRAVDVAEPAKLSRLLSFGRDTGGELYALGTTAAGDGAVHRIVPPG